MDISGHVPRSDDLDQIAELGIRRLRLGLLWGRHELRRDWTVPRAALRTEGPANYVFRVVEGRLQRTPVVPGIVNLDRAEIAKGLSENDVVALNAVDNRSLQDALAVRIGRGSDAGSGLGRLLRMRILGPGQR